MEHAPFADAAPSSADGMLDALRPFGLRVDGFPVTPERILTLLGTLGPA